MRSIIFIIILFIAGFIFSSCEKKDYPAGLTELEHHYYALFVPNNNSAVTVSRSQTALLKFPVQFYSTFTREYDAVAKYAVVTGGITGPAQDRKSTRLNSSHSQISYAVFCLKKKRNNISRRAR